MPVACQWVGKEEKGETAGKGTSQVPYSEDAGAGIIRASCPQRSVSMAEAQRLSALAQAPFQRAERRMSRRNFPPHPKPLLGLLAVALGEIEVYLSRTRSRAEGDICSDKSKKSQHGT
jgi:hypothetical protein